jgi:uncharacterized repeat protein (TIGR01451 family)
VANLVVGGFGPTGTVAGGGAATFTMTVTNSGPADATNVSIIDDPFTDITVTGVTCTASGGATCPSATGLTMTVPVLPASGILQFNVAATVRSGVSGAIANRLTATADNQNTSTRSANAFTATGTAYTAQAGVFVTGTATTPNVVGGGSATYLMVVQNSGPDAATSVKITNQVGSNLTLTGVSCSAAGGATCPSPTGVVMNVPTLPNGGTLNFTVTATVAAGTNGTIVNSMTATSPTDPNRSDSTAVATATASTSRATLVVGGSFAGGPVSGGGTATFTMTVQNTGPDDAQAVHLVDTVGSNLTLTGVSCAAAAGAACPTTTGPVMDIPVLPLGGTLTFTVQASVANLTNGAIVNTLNASASNDQLGSTRSATAVGQAQTAVSNLLVTGTAPAGLVPAGTATTFTMAVTNTGPQPATNIQFTDTPGGNLTFTGITCSASGTPDTVCPTPGVTMTLATLPVGGTLTFTVSALVASATNGAIINTLNVVSTTSGTRSQVAGTAVGNAYASNLSVQSIAPASPVPGGGSASFTMVVSNAGPGTAQNVAVVDTVSANLALDGSRIVCTPAPLCPTAAASMIVPSIPPGASVSFVVPVTVNANANGNESNTLSVSAPGDVHTNGVSASATVQVFSANLAVTQTAPASVAVGGTAAITATVSNPGPGAANNVTINTAVSVNGVATSNWTVASCTPVANCPTALGPSMTLPSLAAGRTLTFTINVPVQSSPSAIASTMTVAGTGNQSSAANSTSTVAVQGVASRNGTYQLYAADGRLYAMTIDFDAGTYTITGNGVLSQKVFTADGSGGFKVTGSSERLRVGQDIVVGNDALGGTTPLPYLAARSFQTSIGNIGGTYDVMTRNVSAASLPVTRAGTARVSGNVLLTCVSNTVITTVQTCASTDLNSYLLSVSGNLFHGVNTVTGAAYDFSVAQSGALSILLSAGMAPDGTQQLLIGIPDAPAIIGGTSLVGPAISVGGTADWVTTTLTTQSYSVTGTSFNYSVGQLVGNGSGGPFSLVSAPRSTDGAVMNLMQSFPLVVVVGNTIETASGDMQIVIP